MTESMLRLKKKVSFRDMEGYVESGSQDKAGTFLVASCMTTKITLKLGSILV